MEAILIIIYLAVIIFQFVAMWKVLEKAGQPGWAIIIPIYNIYILLKVAGRPGWWLLLMLIPLANIIVSILMYLDIAGKFGKGTGFAIGLFFLPIIFFPILAFGQAQYTE